MSWSYAKHPDHIPVEDLHYSNSRRYCSCGCDFDTAEKLNNHIIGEIMKQSLCEHVWVDMHSNADDTDARVCFKCNKWIIEGSGR